MEIFLVLNIFSLYLLGVTLPPTLTKKHKEVKPPSLLLTGRMGTGHYIIVQRKYFPHKCVSPNVPFKPQLALV